MSRAPGIYVLSTPSFMFSVPFVSEGEEREQGIKNLFEVVAIGERIKLVVLIQHPLCNS